MATRLTLAALSLALLLTARSAFGAEPREREVQRAMTEFLTAFNNLDWPVFRRLWSSDASLFLPPVSSLMTSPERAKRITTADSESAWQELFASVRQRSGRTAPPYQSIQPQDLRVDIVADSVAIVSFCLGNSTTVGRRTLVWKRTDDGWKIVHLHASMVEMPSANYRR